MNFLPGGDVRERYPEAPAQFSPREEPGKRRSACLRGKEGSEPGTSRLLILEKWPLFLALGTCVTRTALPIGHRSAEG